MFAEARRTPKGGWEVYCGDCALSIGTMNGETFNRAIMFAIPRGGMKCPECRINSCGKCHLLIGHAGLCTLCKLEAKAENKAFYDFLN